MEVGPTSEVTPGDGRTAKLQGKLAMCRDCHDTADVDFRFGPTN